MALGNEPVVDALINDVADLQALVADLRDQIAQKNSLIGATRHIEALYGRTEYLHEQGRLTSAWVKRTIRAHNRHVLAGAPDELAPGWARRRAQDARTWAKPKGWRL